MQQRFALLLIATLVVLASSTETEQSTSFLGQRTMTEAGRTEAGRLKIRGRSLPLRSALAQEETHEQMVAAAEEEAADFMKSMQVLASKSKQYLSHMHSVESQVRAERFQTLDIHDGFEKQADKDREDEARIQADGTMRP